MKSTRRSKVLILLSGGTIGMRLSSGPGPMSVPEVSPAELRKRLMSRVPELVGLADCEIQIALNRDSAHVGPQEWIQFAHLIRKQWRRFDGIVLLHGTDTLAYTASALSFLLHPCLKPVILTGAQRPLEALRTDARRNLISAVEIAAMGPRPGLDRVAVFFNDQLYQGNRVRKRSASQFEAFESPIAPSLAVVGTDIQFARKIAALPRKGLRLKAAFSPRVAVLHVTPGFPSTELAGGLLSELDALVLVIFPSGTAPTHDPHFVTLLAQARERHLPVIAVTQGYRDSGGEPRAQIPGLSNYAAGQDLVREGVLWAGEMTLECAYVKAAWILGQKRSKISETALRRFVELWKTDFAGEGLV